MSKPEEQSADETCPYCLQPWTQLDHELFWTSEWVDGRMKSVMCCTYAHLRPAAPSNQEGEGTAPDSQEKRDE